MELEDCDYPNLGRVTITSDPKVAFENIDYGIFLGSNPLKPEMERKDLLPLNQDIYIQQGKALNEVAKKSCKIVSMANPV